MKPLRDRKEERQFFDVYRRPESRRAKRLRDAFSDGSTVNLRPNFFKRYPYSTATVVIFFTLGILIGNRVLTRAEVADFYPSTCLGTWENVANAAGAPENFNTTNVESGYSAENSAVYRVTDSQIFCGGFLATDEETKGDLKSAALTLIWHVGTLESSTVVGVIEQPVEEPSSSAATSTDTLNVEAPTGTSLRADESLFALFHLDRANAQEADVPPAPPPADPAPPPPADTETPPQTPAAPPPDVPPPAPPTLTPEPAPTPSPEPEVPIEPSSSTIIIATEEEPPIILPPLQAELTPVETSTPPTAEPSSTVPTSTLDALPPPPAPPPDENFLAVSYSFDGQTWTELAQVNPDNWENFTVTLPVTSWGELKNLQIAVRGIPTSLNPVPLVYLAGMFVEAHYDLPPLFGVEQEAAPTDPSLFPIVDLDPSRRLVPINGGSGTWSAGETPEFDLDIAGLGLIASSASATSSTPVVPDEVPVPSPASPALPDLTPPTELPAVSPPDESLSPSSTDVSDGRAASATTDIVPPVITPPPLEVPSSTVDITSPTSATSSGGSSDEL